MTHAPRIDHDAERGTSLIELMIALVVLSLGILAVAQLFPAGSRGQVQDRMTTAGIYYAQEQLEELNRLSWSDAALTVGRHPPGTATEDLGPTGKWHRYYDVSILPAPLDNLKKVTVTVTWTFMGARSVQSTTYLRR
ncbi:MAG: prepilin-type N-terminal cleavage/methylation domain-containing protein [Candidatus Eisenbacteria bacterium]